MRNKFIKDHLRNLSQPDSDINDGGRLKAYFYYDDLVDYIEGNFEPVSYECDKCNYSTIYRQDFMQHMQNEHNLFGTYSMGV